MKTYKGTREGTTHHTSRVVVTDDSAPGMSYALAIRTQHGAAYPKSPDGHAWGYGGSGPSQLALDVLWDYMSEEPHPALFQAFKEQFIEGVAESTWQVTGHEIQHWLDGWTGPVLVGDRL